MIAPSLSLYILRLVLGGIAAFFAILLWSKTRDAAWMSLVAGVVTNYAGLVYSLLVDFGIVLEGSIKILGIPLISLCFTVIPYIFFILAFILFLIRNK